MAHDLNHYSSGIHSWSLNGLVEWVSQSFFCDFNTQLIKYLRESELSLKQQQQQQQQQNSSLYRGGLTEIKLWRWDLDQRVPSSNPGFNS